MKRMTRNISGKMAYMRRRWRLTYREGKPEVFKMQVVRGNVIGKQEIVAYAAKAAHVPESSILLAVNALFDALAYFCENGHRVQVPGLGSFAPYTKSKVARSEEECNADTIKCRRIEFYPEGDLKSCCASISFEENRSLTQNAIGLVSDGQAVTDAFGRKAWFKGYVYEDDDEGMAFVPFNPDSLPSNYVSVPGSWSEPGREGSFHFGLYDYTVTGGKLSGFD